MYSCEVGTMYWCGCVVYICMFVLDMHILIIGHVFKQVENDVNIAPGD